MKTQFQLTQPAVIYKIQKGFGGTISNKKMTDELAIKFLQVKPDRIQLFSKYPENWKELIGLDDEKTADEKVIKIKEAEPIKDKPCSDCKDKKITGAKSTPKKSTTKKAVTKSTK